jgi:Family of unknown function (DUF6653)
MLWMKNRDRVASEYRVILRRLILFGLIAFLFIAWGLWHLRIWPTVYGATLLILAQLWRIDRMGFLYEELAQRQGLDQARIESSSTDELSDA